MEKYKKLEKLLLCHDLSGGNLLHDLYWEVEGVVRLYARAQQVVPEERYGLLFRALKYGRLYAKEEDAKKYYNPLGTRD